MSTFAKLRKKINSPYPLPQNPPHHGFLRQAKHITEGGWEKDVNKGTPLPTVQAPITRAAQTSCSPLGPCLSDLSSQRISKQIQRKCGEGVGRVNTNIKARNCKQSAVRGRGPSSAPPPPRGPAQPSPARLPGPGLPPFPPGAPHGAVPPAPAAIRPPGDPPAGAATPGRARRSGEAPGPARPTRRRCGLSPPRTAAPPRPGELRARRGGRNRGWAVDGAGGAAVPPPAPPRAAPPLTRRWCASCWSCNRRPDRGGGAWTWRWRVARSA